MHTDGVGRKLSKIEKRGAKVERTTLHIALQELAEIQKLQEASIQVKPFLPDKSGSLLRFLGGGNILVC
jgi:hypothetical protein